MNGSFLMDCLREEYAREIQGSYHNARGGRDRRDPIDLKKLDHELSLLLKVARHEGLPGHEFLELVQQNLPALWSHLRVGLERTQKVMAPTTELADSKVLPFKRSNPKAA